ncbi:type VI secretion system protein, partial [Anaeromyxobacter soli]|uniref:type VI secretion system protein n=1 Tax=Anaeromyxobacter soli TaxID=2922725 RepID=UPI001FAED815
MEPRFLHIAAALARRRTVRAGGVALLAAGFAGGSLPLLDAPGYELGEAGALLAAALAPFLALAAVRAETDRPAPSPAAAFGGAVLVLSALLALLFAGSVARAALGPCSALTRAAAFFPLLALPSALLAAAVATLAAVAARGRALLAGVLYAAALAASLAFTLATAYRGPAAFLFDPLLGAWPGPLYDEALPIDARLLLFRGEAAAWGAALVALAEAALRARRAGLRGAAAPLAALLVAAGAAAGARAARDALGLSGDRDGIVRALGARRDGPRCTLLLPAEKPAAAASALLSECEFGAADVARALGLAAPPRVTVFVYRSAAEKRRLVGAAATEYAKPWLAEVHVVDAPSPHPVLRHELVHALAGAIAKGPLRVPARAGLLPSAGLVEGLAVALEIPRGDWTVHEWSRAARDLGLLPDVAAIVGPAGFWTQAPARAYTASGSFLAFLLERHGAAKLARAYRDGDVAAAFGVPLEALVAEWQSFLDGVAVPPGLEAAARARLGRKSLFARRCAREAAALALDASGAAASGRTAQACRLWRRFGAFGEAAGAEKAAGDALARGGELGDAAAAYAAARARAAPEDAALRAALSSAEGDLAWRAGDLPAADRAWATALAAHPDRAEARLLEAKRAAVADPAMGAAARPYLLGEGDPALALASVARAEGPLSAYLVGRALASRGEARAALPELARAEAGPLPPALAAEARALHAEARCLSGETGAGEAELAAIAASAASAA